MCNPLDSSPLQFIMFPGESDGAGKKNKRGITEGQSKTFIIYREGWGNKGVLYIL